MTVYAPVGAEFTVNSTYARSQFHSDSAQLADGNIIIVWVDGDPNTTANRFIRAQVYQPDGTPVGVELTLRSGSGFNNPAVTGLSNGGFVVTWGGFTGVVAQAFDAGGTATTALLTITPTTASGGSRADVAALADGGFAVSWHDERTTGGDVSRSGVHVRTFDASGTAYGDTLVNVATAGNQADSSIAALPDGRYIVTWTDRGAPGAFEPWLIKGRLLDSTGAPMGSEFVVNSVTANAGSVESSVTVLANGNFAVGWFQADYDLGNLHRIQLFDPSGAPIGPEITVPVASSGTAVGPKLVALADGGFALAWTANSAPQSDGSGSSVLVQTFDAAGQPSGNPLPVNTQTNGDQFDIALVALAGGGFVVSWTDLNGAGSDDDEVKAQTFLPMEPVAIVSDGGGDTATVAADENQSGVTQVVADSAGSGANIAFSIDGGADAALFAIDPATGVLSFANAPDFEAPSGDGDNLYEVVVRASNAVFSDTQAIMVAVRNVNEAPVITSDGGGTSASLTLAENTTTVTTVVASDVDGQAIQFSIVGGNDAALFAIDPDTGVLTFVNAPDYEAPGDFAGDNFYTLTVAASDAALSVTQSIEILVTNVNEGVTITSLGGGASAAIGLAENQLDVTSVSATDLDGDAVTYSLAGGSDAALFTIDAQTGALRFITAPDYEAPADADGDNIYEVVVSASDGSLGDTQVLAITVANANERAGITSYGGAASAALTVSENEANAAVVTATDPDGDVLTYSLAGGADAALFTVDAQTGALRFIAAPDYEAPADANRDNVYEVVVAASDGSLATSQSLSLTVANVAEAAHIIGTAGNDIISTTQTVPGQALATVYGDTIEGRAGADVISGGGGNDTIDGGAGNDRLAGEAGRDLLTGGLGADIFGYRSLGDSMGTARDTITDYSRQQGDRISLTAIDARAGTTFNDAFKFIGTKAFSNEAGQLRYEQSGGNTLIMGDVNGDGVADFQIELLGTHKLAATDFQL